HLDPCLISAFVERWHEETSSYHMPAGEITVTLDDVSCLLHLPLRGRLQDHITLSKEEGVIVMVNLLGAELVDALYEVTKTKCAHAMTTYLKGIFKHHIEQVAHFTALEDEES
ncbi:serine/threonine-protein phosphatase 7 long form-like protein, partial [Trifolium medium]|nr:serine/threonine-protein phosphatase 7 long form-like protein [Trifolium medium]